MSYIFIPFQFLSLSLEQ